MSRSELFRSLTTSGWNGRLKPSRARVLWLAGPCHQQRCFSVGRGSRAAPNVSEMSLGIVTKKVVRPTASWLLPPKNTSFDPEQILKQLPRCIPDKTPRQLSSAVFLVTPKFAHLVENGSNWLDSAMNIIFPKPVGQNHSVRFKNSYVAIVDALPATHSRVIRLSSEFSGHEGVALCVTYSPEKEVRSEGTADEIPTISFQSQRSEHVNIGGYDVIPTYQAPVANTLFVNGQRSTMFCDRWQTIDGKLTSLREPQDLSKMTLPLYDAAIHKAINTIFHVNLIKLTDPAQIVSSMGNIVREIKLKDGTIVSASHELEKVVPPLVKQMQEANPNGELRVFAVVYPNVKGKTNPFREHFYQRIPDRGSIDQLRYKTLAKRLVAQSGRMHRVTSGGAGWGKKAGLLSLDPKTIHNQQEDELSASTTSFFLDGEGMPESTNHFPPGMSIQFLASWHDTTGEVVDGLAADNSIVPVWAGMNYFFSRFQQRWCIGTTIVPEVIDSNHSKIDSEPRDDNLMFCPGQFGFLSTGPLGITSRSISQDGEETPDVYSNSTLIEVPNSSILSKFPACGVYPAEQRQQSTTSEKNQSTRTLEQALTDDEFDKPATSPGSSVSAKAQQSLFTEGNMLSSNIGLRFRKIAPGGLTVRNVVQKKLIIRKIADDESRMKPRSLVKPPPSSANENERRLGAQAREAEWRRKKHEMALRQGYSSARRKVDSDSSIFSKEKENLADMERLLNEL